MSRAGWAALAIGLVATAQAFAQPSDRSATPPTAKAPPAGDQGDVVESIDTGTVTPAPPIPPIAIAPAPHARFSASGWARARLSVGLYRTGEPAPPDPTLVPHDRLIAQQQLFLRLRYHYGHSFEAVASGLLDFAAFEQDAPLAEVFTLFNGAGTRTSYAGSLREAYVGVFWKRLDFRIGQQRIAWGRGDAFTINDVLDGYDLRDQGFAETDVLHLPSFAARAGIDLGFGSLELVAQPFFQPNQFDVYGGNWAIIQADAPAPYRAALRAATSGLSPTLHDALQPLLAQTELPASDFSSTQAGLRFAVDLHRFDFALYYHYGFDRTPDFQIDPRFAASLGSIDFSKPVDLSPLVQPLLAGNRPVSATYVRRHHAGIDLATTAGPVLFRVEGAYDSARVYIGRDLQGVVSPVVQASGGIEYQTGALGQIILVEGWYMHGFDLPAARPLLFYQADTGGLATLWRWTFFRQWLEVELRAMVGLDPFSWSIKPQVGLHWRGLRVQVGALVLDGDRYSFGNYFRDNTSVYVLTRYSF